MRNVALFAAAAAVLGLGAASCSSAGRSGGETAGALRIGRLRAEYRENPLGLDTPQPRLNWILASDRRGQRQTAFRILAASSPEGLAEGRADLWDSGKVDSAESVHVLYAGTPLRSGQRVHWTARAWDRDGRPSAYAAPAWFEMGLLDPADWRAEWITRPRPDGAPEPGPFDDRPAPLFRREFTVDKPVARARAYVSGVGYYELRLNGERVGDHVLDPGWTTCAKRVLYSTYDVTAQVKPGRNAVGAMLGRGWYDPLPLKNWGWLNIREHLAVGPPRLILHLRIDFADGTSQALVTDGTWRCGDGPVLRDSVYLGEVYDARREQPGWDRAGFDDARWAPAAAAAEALGPLRAQDAPPIRVKEVLPAVARTEPKPGVFVFDLGRNFAGWARLRVRAPAGTRVSLRHGELLNPDGTLNGLTAVCGQIKGGGKDYRYDGTGAPKTAWQNDVYVCRGGGEEVFTPHFTFHGFRYVEVTGYPGTPPPDAVEGLVLHSDVEPAGSFSCSNGMFNRIQEMVLRTERSNLFSVQSDCPHREKFGYGGDLVAASEMGILNFDMARFYAKAVRDFADAARPNGGITETAPFVGIADEGLGGGAGPVGWGTAFPLLQWQLYQYYGDRGMLEERWEATKRWIALLESKARDGILDNGISDHESLVPKPKALTGTAFLYWNLRLAERIARVLGRADDAGRYAASAAAVRDAFNRKFLKPGTGVFDTGTQACQAFALHLDLAPPAERAAALDALVRGVEARQGHLSTGIFGTRFMLLALADGGRAGTAFGLVNQTTFPGWGHMLERGATTLWEHWEFSDNTYSHNHPMFGSVSEWFVKALAGIAPEPDAAGFDRFQVRPRVTGDLAWVKGRYESVRGPVACAWKIEGETLALDVEVPVGATATVFVPAADAAGVTEGGRPAREAEGVAFLRYEAGAAVYRVGSGAYRFTSKGWRRE